MHLTLEFGGGLELLCESVKVHNVNVDMPKGADKLTMKDLLAWVRTNLIKERPEMFIKGESVRPGVLVLVNDCDWELSGQLDTTLEEKDVGNVFFFLLFVINRNSMAELVSSKGLSSSTVTNTKTQHQEASSSAIDDNAKIRLQQIWKPWKRIEQ
ncbi:hypothetical protein V6N13_146525 [Hibiscus sabdariffa]|uniref:Ubiquitin-related modifier 1 homolog n=1 Tax=Hibiscus sabdariffa TaxID=183260 RepID=A0ABR2TSV1_9ROSI